MIDFYYFTFILKIPNTSLDNFNSYSQLSKGLKLSGNFGNRLNNFRLSEIFFIKDICLFIFLWGDFY
jgi:hypothetical protein